MCEGSGPEKIRRPRENGNGEDTYSAAFIAFWRGGSGEL